MMSASCQLLLVRKASLRATRSMKVILFNRKKLSASVVANGSAACLEVEPAIMLEEDKL